MTLGSTKKIFIVQLFWVFIVIFCFDLIIQYLLLISNPILKIIFSCINGLFLQIPDFNYFYLLWLILQILFLLFC